MNISAVIFDLDGLLSDTEILHMRAYREALKNQNVDLSDADYISHWIKNGSGIQEYDKMKNLNLDIPAIRKDKAEWFESLLNTDLKPMPYAREILAALHKKKRMAVASSSYRHNVEAILEKLALRDYFEVVVSGSDVEKTKPSPDIFILTAEKLSVKAEHCIVIEDAEKGIKAAAAAGMKSIAVPDKHTMDNDFSAADFVVESLVEVEKLLL